MFIFISVGFFKMSHNVLALPKCRKKNSLSSAVLLKLNRIPKVELMFFAGILAMLCCTLAFFLFL